MATKKKASKKANSTKGKISVKRRNKMVVLENCLTVLRVNADGTYSAETKAEKRIRKQKRKALEKLVYQSIKMIDSIKEVRKRFRNIDRIKNDKSIGSNPKKNLRDLETGYLCTELNKMLSINLTNNQQDNQVEAIYLHCKSGECIIDYTDLHNVKVHGAIKTIVDGKVVYSLGDDLIAKGKASSGNGYVQPLYGWYLHELMLLPRMYADTSDPANIGKVAAWYYGNSNYLHINHKNKKIDTADCSDLELCTMTENSAHGYMTKLLELKFNRLSKEGLLQPDYFDKHFLGVSVKDISKTYALDDYLKAALSNKDAGIFLNEVRNRGLIW